MLCMYHKETCLLCFLCLWLERQGSVGRGFCEKYAGIIGEIKVQITGTLFCSSVECVCVRACMYPCTWMVCLCFTDCGRCARHLAAWFNNISQQIQCSFLHSAFWPPSGVCFLCHALTLCSCFRHRTPCKETLNACLFL